jgi:hypothetical protein
MEPIASDSKEVLVKKIKEWIAMDSEIARLNKEAKAVKAQKKEINDFLLNVMKANDINCFNITGGSLVYKKNTVKKSLSSKTLTETLTLYFKEQTSEEDPTKARALASYILSHRPEGVKESILRKPT